MIDSEVIDERQMICGGGGGGFVGLRWGTHLWSKWGLPRRLARAGKRGRRWVNVINERRGLTVFCSRSSFMVAHLFRMFSRLRERKRKSN